MKTRYLFLFLVMAFNLAGQAYFINTLGVSELTSLFLLVMIGIVAISVLIGCLLISGLFFRTQRLTRYILIGSLLGVLINLMITTWVNHDRKATFTSYLESPYSHVDSIHFKFESRKAEEIPLELVSREKVQVMRIRMPALTRLPEDLPEIKYLKRLEIIGPDSLDLEQAMTVLGRTDIESFILTSANLIFLPTGLSRLKSLKALNLSSNPDLDLDSLFVLLRELPALEKLNLSHGQSEALPSAIADLRNLTELQLAFSHFTSLPEELEEMPRLETLVLNEVPVIKKWWHYVDSSKVSFKVVPEHQWRQD